MAAILITSLNDRVLALLPLVPVLAFSIPLIGNPIATVQSWIQFFFSSLTKSHEVLLNEDDLARRPSPPVESQLLAYLTVAVLGYILTNRLIPNIAQYTLRKGISGKDLGKRGTPLGDKEMYVFCVRVLLA